MSDEKDYERFESTSLEIAKLADSKHTEITTWMMAYDIGAALCRRLERIEEAIRCPCGEPFEEREGSRDTTRSGPRIWIHPGPGGYWTWSCWHCGQDVIAYDDASVAYEKAVEHECTP